MDLVRNPFGNKLAETRRGQLLAKFQPRDSGRVYHESRPVSMCGRVTARRAAENRKYLDDFEGNPSSNAFSFTWSHGMPPAVHRKRDSLYSSANMHRHSAMAVQNCASSFRICKHCRVRWARSLLRENSSGSAPIQRGRWEVLMC